MDITNQIQIIRQEYFYSLGRKDSINEKEKSQKKYWSTRTETLLEVLIILGEEIKNE